MFIIIKLPSSPLVLVYRFFRTGITRSSAPTGPMTGDKDGGGNQPGNVPVDYPPLSVPGHRPRRGR